MIDAQLARGLSPARRWVVRVVQAAVVAALVAYATSLLVRGSGHPNVFWDAWVGNSVIAGGAALCALRGAFVPAQRAAWFTLAGGLVAYDAGGVYWWVRLSDLTDPPYPSWSDVGYLLVYPAAYTALLLLVRVSVARLQTSVWLDGVVGGLSAAAVSASLFFGSIVAATGGGRAAVATNLAYPVGDLLLLVLVCGVFALMGWRPGRGWALLAVGFTVFAVGDTLYLFQIAAGTYTVGTPLDVTWALAITLIGLAAWQRPAPPRLHRLQGTAVLVMPLVCTVASLGVLYRATLTATSPVATSLALVAVLAALGRTALSFREVRALAESRRQALTDELTGLPNRRWVYQTLAEERTVTAEGSLAVFLVDLDRFKEINDSLGHAAGDALLRQVGPRLRSRLRHGDLLARLGGDEFVVLSRHVATAQDALSLAEALRAELRRPFAVGSMPLGVDASIGVARGPGDAEGGEELLQLADLAMYAAKRDRTGVACYDDVLHGQGRHRLETVEQLRAGMARGELVCHYQPKVHLPDRCTTGVEALVRWVHPERGLLYPDAFIDLAEAFGLMGDLTLTVARIALQECREWWDAGQRLSVAVNVSPSNLVAESFPDAVASLLDEAGLPPTALVLEVTESLLMADRERAVAVLSRLRAAGVAIAIDDYGTGYSSLAYLAELPVSELKLDRAFIAAMDGDDRSTAIVTSTVQLAHAMGLVLVAEGVEDERTFQALDDLGCDVVQGYHIARPMPGGHLLAWLAQRGTDAASPAASGPRVVTAAG